MGKCLRLSYIGVVLVLRANFLSAHETLRF